MEITTPHGAMPEKTRRISHKQAQERAYAEYDIFYRTQPIESDFDRVVKEIAKK